MALLSPQECHHDRTARAIDRLDMMTDAGAQVLEEHWFCLDCGVTTQTAIYDKES